MAGRSWVFAGICLLGLVGCSRQPAPPPEEQPGGPAGNLLLAAATVALPPGVPAAELPDSQSKGAELMAKYCGGACHGIPAPSSHAQTDWPVVLRRMWLRMEKIDTTYHVAVPTNAERAMIMDYLLAYALQVTAAALPNAPGKDVFVGKCGRCHGLPDPKQHSAEDWVAVVRRMNGRMEKMLGEVLSQDEMQRIVLYLGKASAGA